MYVTVLCSGEKPHVCSVCGKTFSQSGSRNVHMKKRHGDETLPPDSRDTGNTLITQSLTETRSLTVFTHAQTV